jgi:membrane dipeptidase
MSLTRRAFLTHSASLAAGAALVPRLAGAQGRRTRPHDYIVVEGHRDIWELNDRFRSSDRKQHSPLRDFLVPRLIDGGCSVVIMPAGGDSVDQRAGDEHLLEGSLRVLDMLLVEIEKTNGLATIIRTKADVPAAPNTGRVQFFLDHEGGGAIQIDPSPGYHRDRRLALLRHFFRLGVRGLGMIVGVSHLSSNGVLHVAEITKHPIVSTHQNILPLVKSRQPLELTPEEVKAVAGTGGVIGLRYIEGSQVPYDVMADECEHLAKTVGVQHIGIGWLGHDAGHPYYGWDPTGRDPGRRLSAVEGQTIGQHWETFIGLLHQRGFTDDDVGMIVGGNFLRVMRAVLPA